MLDTSTLQLEPAAVSAGTAIPFWDERYFGIVSEKSLIIYDTNWHTRTIPLDRLPVLLYPDDCPPKCQVFGHYLYVSGTTTSPTSTGFATAIYDLDTGASTATIPSDAWGPTVNHTNWPRPLGDGLMACDLGPGVVGVCDVPRGRVLYKVGNPVAQAPGGAVSWHPIYAIAQTGVVSDTGRVIVVDEGSSVTTIISTEAITGKGQVSASTPAKSFVKAGLCRFRGEWCVWILSANDGAAAAVEFLAVRDLKHVLTVRLPEVTSAFEAAGQWAIVTTDSEVTLYDLAH